MTPKNGRCLQLDELHIINRKWGGNMKRTDFFRRLHAYSDKYLELRAFPSKSRTFIDLKGDSFEDDLNRFCHDHENENLFFAVASRDGRGGTKENIVSIPCVFADIDFKDTFKEIVKEKLKAFPFKPSIIIHSGNGIHLYWLLNETAGRDEIPVIEDVNRRIAQYMGGDFNACDASRILRVPDTMNLKDPNNPKECRILSLNDYEYDQDDFLNILPEVPTRSHSSKHEPSGPEWLDKAMSGCATGQRNAMGAKIAGYWINKLPARDVLTILKTWNVNCSPPLSEKEIKTIVKSVSRYEPAKKQGGVDLANVYDAERMIQEYMAYIENLGQNRFITGIREIDYQIRGVAGGEVLTIIARAGSFKTAILQNMLLNYVQNSAWGAVFFSIEMPVASVTERYFSILDGCPGKEVELLFRDAGSSSVRKAAESQFKQDLKRLFVVPAKVSLSMIAAYVSLIEKAYNLKIGVIGIDYLGLIDSPGINEYDVVSRVARGAKDVAKLLNLPVVILSQVSRRGGEGETEVSLDMGRGSGAIEEGADFVLGLWQQADKSEIIDEAESEHYNYDLICRILKNRKGPKGSTWKLDLHPECLYIGPFATKHNPRSPVRNSY